jgi:hypothetical protein
MTFKLKNSMMMFAVASALAAPLANAGGTITFGEDKSISVGFGMIAGYSSVEDGADNGDDRSSDFSLGSTRLYLSGSMNKYIKGMVNTEKTGTGGSWEVIDANVQIQVTPQVAIWAGRFLPPSDRANMAVPYYSMGGGYWANIASRYGWNGGTIGRDEGVALVSSLMDDHLAISFGAFEGNNIFRFSGVDAQSEGSDAAKALGADDDLMYAGRVQYDFWDAEPGYYGTGNYFGAKDILAIGVSAKQKGDGSISATAVGDYTNVSVDFLMEKKNVGAGTLSLEAAYYDYDTDDVFLAEQGDAYAVGLGYLLNSSMGWGKLMPFVRYQAFDADNNVETKKVEVGANYIIAPYNALITAAYSDTKVDGGTDSNAFNLTMQFQF